MWEASVASVVVPGIFSENVREVKVSIQGLGHSAALRKPLEVWMQGNSNAHMSATCRLNIHSNGLFLWFIPRAESAKKKKKMTLDPKHK